MKMINNLKGAKPPKVITDLRHLVSSGAECFGDRTLYFYKNTNGEYTQYSYDRLWVEMNRLGTAFSLLGIGDKHIAVSGDTHPRWIATYLACINGNGCIVPIDKELTIDATADFLELGECVAFVYTAAQNEKAKELAGKDGAVLCFGSLYSIGDIKSAL